MGTPQSDYGRFIAEHGIDDLIVSITNPGDNAIALAARGLKDSIERGNNVKAEISETLDTFSGSVLAKFAGVEPHSSDDEAGLEIGGGAIPYNENWTIYLKYHAEGKEWPLMSSSSIEKIEICLRPSLSASHDQRVSDFLVENSPSAVFTREAASAGNKWGYSPAESSLELSDDAEVLAFVRGMTTALPKG